VHGLAEVGNEGRTWVVAGGSAGAAAWQLTFQQLHAPILATGLVTEAELAAACARLTDPTLAFLAQVTLAAWGRRPLAVV
jgi:hypothetical protein